MALTISSADSVSCHDSSPVGLHLHRRRGRYRVLVAIANLRQGRGGPSQRDTVAGEGQAGARRRVLSRRAYRRGLRRRHRLPSSRPDFFAVADGAPGTMSQRENPATTDRPAPKGSNHFCVEFCRHRRQNSTQKTSTWPDPEAAAQRSENGCVHQPPGTSSLTSIYFPPRRQIANSLDRAGRCPYRAVHPRGRRRQMQVVGAH
jgi:hypothetical protein